VIKTLIKYEKIELSKKEPEVLEQKVYIYEYENSWKKQVVVNPIVTIGVPVVIGAILYAILR
jgi:hypothetical protein